MFRETLERKVEKDFFDTKITDDMVIAIHPGDTRKRYAKKMESLEKV